MNDQKYINMRQKGGEPLEPTGRPMLKGLLTAGIILCASIAPGVAENIAVPSKDPIATLTVPDKWETQEIEWGYSATSPDGGLAFYVESAPASRVENLFATNDEWLKENNIKPKGEHSEAEVNIAGLPAKVFSYPATDDDGDTVIDFVVIQEGKGRVILLTLWGSQEDREANQDDLDAIKKSIKPIN